MKFFANFLLCTLLGSITLTSAVMGAPSKPSLLRTRNEHKVKTFRKVQESSIPLQRVYVSSQMDCILGALHDTVLTDAEKILISEVSTYGQEHVTDKVCVPALAENTPTASVCGSVAEYIAELYSQGECLDEFIVEDEPEVVQEEAPPSTILVPISTNDDGNGRLLSIDPSSTKIDVCVDLLENLIMPFNEYNCYATTVRVCVFKVCRNVANPVCSIVRQCCNPGVCRSEPLCGLARVFYDVVASAGTGYCFKGITAGDLWNRLKAHTVSMVFSTLERGIFDVLCEVVKSDIEAMYAGATPLHPDVIALMEEIRAIDNTPLSQSWSEGALNDVRIHDKASLGANSFWVQMHAITLGRLILFDQTADYNLLTNPPKNNQGSRVTLVDLQDGNVADFGFYSALSTLLHEMVHVQQYTEMGTCTFLQNYLLDIVFNGYDGAAYEVEAYAYQQDIVPYKICGRYCTQVTDETSCRAVCPKHTFRSFQASPVAICKNALVETLYGGTTAQANIDGGSYDPDSTALTFTQVPPGPYSMGVTNVVLTVMDDWTASSTCQATVTVVECLSDLSCKALNSGAQKGYCSKNKCFLELNCVFGVFDKTTQACNCSGGSYVPGYCQDQKGACTVYKVWDSSSSTFVCQPAVAGSSAPDCVHGVWDGSKCLCNAGYTSPLIQGYCPDFNGFCTIAQTWTGSAWVCPSAGGTPPPSCVHGSWDGTKCVCTNGEPSLLQGYCRNSAGICTVPQKWTGSLWTC